MAEPNVIRFPGAAQVPGALVRFSDVSVRRGGALVLHAASFDLRAGGITTLLGANGAGKSLCLKLAAGLIPADLGQVERTLPLSKIAYVPQRAVVLRRSVQANLSHALRLTSLNRRARAERLELLLSLGRLTAAARQPAHSLSGGEIQRLTLVRALANRPSVLLLDEPSASLDPGSTARLEALMREISQEGTKLVLVTHDVGQARRVADDVVFLARGQVAEIAPAKPFFDGPRSAAAQAFLTGRLLT